MGKSYQVKKRSKKKKKSKKKTKKKTLLSIIVLYVKPEQRYLYPCKRVHHANLQFKRGNIIIILKILKGGRCLPNVF